jgi:hypothetical protein
VREEIVVTGHSRSKNGVGLGRVAALPGWGAAYDLLPGKRLTHYV